MPLGHEDCGERIDELERKVAHLREMCIDREDRIDSEWGTGSATLEQLGKEIDDELLVRMTRKRIQ